MPKCPECEEGIMYFDRQLRQYVCSSCGLLLTYAELKEEIIKRKIAETSEEKEKKRHREWLKWLLSPKKK